MLAENLSRLATDFSYERGKPFAASRFGDFVRKDMVVEVKKRLIYWPFDLKVKASVGNGNWAAVPWLAFFDPLVTETATRGFYVVYLVNPQTETFYLSMNQGTTAIDLEFGVKNGRDILRRRAQDMTQRIADHAKHFDTSPIDLGSTAKLPSGYEAGHAFGRAYQARSVSEEEVISDLQKMLFAYEALVNRGGTVPSDAMHEDAETTDIEETRKYVLSRRIERAPKVRREVLAKRSAICEACGLNPKTDYKYNGKPDTTPLDVHHAKPLSGLAEGETRRYKIPDDFIVLCPTCHRMIHKQNDPSDLKALKSLIGFRHARDIGFSNLG